MNLFVISQNPVECAAMLDDRRVNKMTTETAQLLNDALIIRNLIPFMGRNNPGHPLSKWVATNESTFLWTFLLLCSLHAEFCRRGKKADDYQHGAYAKAYWPCMDQVHLFPDGKIIPFHNSSLFKNEQDTFIAYRQTMIHKWTNYKHKEVSTRWAPKWTNAERPAWADNPIPEVIIPVKKKRKTKDENLDSN